MVKPLEHIWHTCGLDLPSAGPVAPFFPLLPLPVSAPSDPSDLTKSEDDDMEWAESGKVAVEVMCVGVELRGLLWA